MNHPCAPQVYTSWIRTGKNLMSILLMIASLIFLAFCAMQLAMAVVAVVCSVIMLPVMPIALAVEVKKAIKK